MLNFFFQVFTSNYVSSCQDELDQRDKSRQPIGQVDPTGQNSPLKRVNQICCNNVFSSCTFLGPRIDMLKLLVGCNRAIVLH